MSVSTHHIDAIDRLLSGSLSESEEKELRNEIAQSPELQTELKLQQRLRAEFEELGKQELKKQLHHKHRRYLLFALLWKLKWGIGIILLLITFSTFYVMLSTPAEKKSHVEHDEPIIQHIISSTSSTYITSDSLNLPEKKGIVSAHEENSLPITTWIKKKIPHIIITKETKEQLYFKEGELTLTGANHLPPTFKLIYLRPFYYVQRDRNYYKLDNGQLTRVYDIRMLQLFRYVKKSDKTMTCTLVQYHVDQQDTLLFLQNGSANRLHHDTLTVDESLPNVNAEWMTMEGKNYISLDRKLYTISDDRLIPTQMAYPKASTSVTIPVYVYDMEKAQYVNEE